MLIFDKTHLKETVFSQVNDFEIFAYALKLDVNVFINIVRTNQRINNPKNITQHPSIGFVLRSRKDGTPYIYCKDFANDNYSGDSIAFLGRIQGLNCNIPAHFAKILNHILEHLNEISQPHIIPDDIYNKIEKAYTINYRQFKQVDANFFRKYDLNITDFTQIDYKPINTILDNITKKYIYVFNTTNIAYSYITNTQFTISKKLYFPYDKNNRFKVINGSTVFEDPNLFDESNKNKIQIITKGRKDKLVLQKHINEIRNDVYVTHVSSETVNFKHYINELFNFYSAVYTFYDLDKTGIINSIKYRKLGIPSLLPNHGLVTLNNIDNLSDVLLCKDYPDTVVRNITIAKQILETILMFI